MTETIYYMSRWYNITDPTIRAALLKNIQSARAFFLTRIKKQEARLGLSTAIELRAHMSHEITGMYQMANTLGYVFVPLAKVNELNAIQAAAIDVCALHNPSYDEHEEQAVNTLGKLIGYPGY